jgi:hypothetical protein
MSPIHRRAIIHFTDNTTLALEWPKQDMQGHVFLSEALRTAVEADRLMVEVEGNLVVIQMRNVKYIELLPVPEHLPQGVLRSARYATPLAAPGAKP